MTATSAAQERSVMKRLGYTRYGAQGGDWGAGVVQAMGRQAPTGLLGIHTNLPAAVTNDVGAALGGGPAPAGLSERERAAIDDLRTYLHNGGLAYLVMMGCSRPNCVQPFDRSGGRCDRKHLGRVSNDIAALVRRLRRSPPPVVQQG